jgi:hypothetical protein
MTPSFRSLLKQWRRSNWLGFYRRVRNYLYGQDCYMTELHGRHTPGIEPYYEFETRCPGRMLLIDQIRVDTGFRENWQCNVCNATLGEIY